MTDARAQRLPAAERRELMLDAASIVFGERGYAGATTDAVARAAGVSQAYIVRTFGSKEALFTEAAQRAVSRIEAVFREAVFRGAAPGAAGNAASAAASRDDVSGDTASSDAVQQRLGRAYIELVADRGILLTVMHLFTLGHHDSFGPLARDGFLRIYRVLRDEVGLTPEEAEGFLARGMLLNTMLGLRLPDVAATEPDAEELLTCVLKDAAAEVVTLAAEQQPLADSAPR